MENNPAKTDERISEPWQEARCVSRSPAPRTKGAPSGGGNGEVTSSTPSAPVPRYFQGLTIELEGFRAEGR